MWVKVKRKNEIFLGGVPMINHQNTTMFRHTMCVNCHSNRTLTHFPQMRSNQKFFIQNLDLLDAGQMLALTKLSHWSSGIGAEDRR